MQVHLYHLTPVDSGTSYAFQTATKHLVMAALLVTRPVAVCLCDATPRERLFDAADVVFLGRPYAALARAPETQDNGRVDTWFSPAYRFAVLESRKVPITLNGSTSFTVLDLAPCLSIGSLGETTLVPRMR